MKSRTFLAFAGGLVLGVAASSLVAYIWGSTAIQRERAEAARLETLVRQRESEIAHESGKPRQGPKIVRFGTGGAATGSQDGADEAGRGKSVTESDAEELRKFREKATTRLAEKRQRKIDERVAALKSRLELSDDQTAAVRALVGKSLPDQTGLMAKLLSGEESDPSGDEVMKMLGPRGSDPQFDEAVAALLNPAQQAEYGKFQQEQRTNQIEISANRELARLQGMMTLSPDQKDRVFAAFTELSGRELDMPPNQLFEPEALDRRQTARIDALKPILTAEQLGVYENSATSIMDLAAPVMEVFDVFTASDFAEGDDGTPHPSGGKVIFRAGAKGK